MGELFTCVKFFIFLFFYFFLHWFAVCHAETDTKKKCKKKKKSFTATPSSYRSGLPADPAIRPGCPGARPVKKIPQWFQKTSVVVSHFLFFFPLTRAVAWYSWPVFQP
jgi:hypothetical protein